MPPGARAPQRIGLQPGVEATPHTNSRMVCIQAWDQHQQNAHFDTEEHTMTESAPPAPNSQDAGGKGLAIAALVLGIVAFFPGCCLSGFYGNYIIAILAIICGAMSLSGPAAGLAKAGLTLGIIAIVLWIALDIVGAEYGESLMQWAEEQQQAQQAENGGSNDFNNDGNNNDGNNDSGSDDGNAD